MNIGFAIWLDSSSTQLLNQTRPTISLLSTWFTCYSRLHVHSKPLNIVYNPMTVAQVKQFLTAPLTGRGRQREEVTPRPSTKTSTGLRIRNRLGDMLQGDSSKVGVCVCMCVYVCVCVCTCVCVDYMRGGRIEPTCACISFYIREYHYISLLYLFLSRHKTTNLCR